MVQRFVVKSSSESNKLTLKSIFAIQGGLVLVLAKVVILSCDFFRMPWCDVMVEGCKWNRLNKKSFSRGLYSFFI